MPAIVDLTQPLADGSPVFPGDPPVVLGSWPTAEPWRVSEVRFGTHSGTHMDAPSHLIPGGSTIDTFGPERWVGVAVAVPVPEARADAPFGIEVLAGMPADLADGWFALLATGWDRHWGRPDHVRHPYPSPELAEALLAAGAGLVGIDTASVDSSVRGGDAAHRLLLGAGVPIVEHLRGLDRLAGWLPHRAVFAPMALAGADGAPVRAIAWLE